MTLAESGFTKDMLKKSDDIIARKPRADVATRRLNGWIAVLLATQPAIM